MGANVGKILKGSYLTAFVALAWYFLYVRNADTMFFMQDRGWWNSTFLFWNDCISVPGGLLSWTGAYLTQYFFYPAIGTSMLIFLWVMTFALAKWSFRVPNEWSFLLVVPLAALLCSDIIITVSACFAFGMETGLFSILGLIIKSLFMDLVTDNLKTKKCFQIITSHPEPIEQFITAELHRGATRLHGEGSYTHEGKTVLLTVVSRHEAVLLRNYIHKQDPAAFMIITSSTEIIGKGFRGVN